MSWNLKIKKICSLANGQGNKKVIAVFIISTANFIKKFVFIDFILRKFQGCLLGNKSFRFYTSQAAFSGLCSIS